MTLSTIDTRLINFLQKTSVPLARTGLFVVYFWFGILKVLGTGLSPATPLVEQLFSATFPFDMSFGAFMIMFGLFECAIGILFIIKGAERIVIPFLFIHMITTIMPLFLIPQATWSGFLVPTLEGQYIIKNILVIAAAVLVAAHMRPMKRRK